MLASGSRDDPPRVAPNAAGTPRSRSRFLWIVLGVAIGVRVAAFFLQPELSYDGTYYLRQAERLRHLQYDWIGFPPGYPLAALLVRLVVGDFVVAGRLVSLVAGILAVGVLARASRRHLPARSAALVALFLAVHPDAVRTSVETLTESLYMLLTLAGMLAFERRRDFVAASFLGGAFLVRPEAAILLAGCVAWRAVQDRRVPWPLAVGFVPIVAYAIPASLAVGHPVLSPKQDQWLLSGLGARLWTWVKVAHGAFPLPLLIASVAMAIRTRTALGLSLVYLCMLPFFDIHLQSRFFVPALPFLTLLFALGLNRLRRPWAGRALAVALVLFGIASAPTYRSLFKGFPLTPQAREIGSALRPHVRFEHRVAGRFPLVAYYAGAGFVRAPRAAAYEALVDSIRSAGATHLLVLESETRDVLPQLRPLFSDARFVAAEGRLRQIAWVDAPPGARAILYRVESPALEPDGADTVRDGIAAPAWLGSRLGAVTTAGEWLCDGHPPVPGVDPSTVPSASPDGSRLAFVRSAGGSRHLAMLDVVNEDVREWRQTAADDPASPTWVEGQILYVRQADPRGLRRLDPGTGRTYDVRIQGMDTIRAWPLFVTCRARDVAITYAQEAGRATRVVATATWPAETALATTGLEGRWAVELRLFAPEIAWLPGADRLIASVQLPSDEPMQPDAAALCSVEPHGALRRLSYGFDRPRLPATAGGAIAFVTGEATLRRAVLDARTVVTPAVRVFETQEPASEPTRRR